MATTWRVERSSSQADGTYLYALYDVETVLAEDLTLEVARLLAAAPELLRELEILVALCELDRHFPVANLASASQLLKKIQGG